MNTELTELARRAVACDGWRWMEGMADLKGRRVVGVGPSGVLHSQHCFHDAEGFINSLPDFNDAATRGCLLALVREMCGLFVWVEEFDGMFRAVNREKPYVEIPAIRRLTNPCPTEVHALVEALEAGSK